MKHASVSKHLSFWKYQTVEPISPWFMRSCMKSHICKLTKVGTIVNDNILKVFIVGLLSYFHSWLPSVLFYLHHRTSHSRSCWHNIFCGGPWPVISWTQACVEIAKFVLSVSKTISYQPVDPNHVISNYCDSSHFGSSQLTVCRFAGWISPVPFQLVISNYIPPLLRKFALQCGQIF